MTQKMFAPTYQTTFFSFTIAKQPQWDRASSLSMIHDHTHTTFSSTPLAEGSAHRTNLYLTTHNTHKRQTSMPPAGFEPAISASGRRKTHILDCAGLRHTVCLFSWRYNPSWLYFHSQKAVFSLLVFEVS